ncbi:MAG: S9 family peptidase [Acidimicrobiia bacterium]|nr:S9 family peptidase [Acidimicrobiia bacterium]MDH5237143.1 S9 family peptidase [Acidimicrobiia bacterium]
MTSTVVPGVEVAPGTCAVVTYTPPTATSPQVGELCAPEDPIGIGMILVHGGGGTSGEYADADQWAAVYRAAGIHTLAIDYELVERDVDAGVWPMPERHTKAAVQYLRRRGADLGIESVQLHGWSAGARLAGIALTTPDHPDFFGPDRWDDVSDAPDAVVLYYGYYSGFVYEPDEYWGGQEIPATAIPENLAASASGPALLVHGDVDFLVPAGESVGFAAALRVAGQEQTLWIINGRPDHGFDGYGTDSLSGPGAELVEPTLDWVRAAAAR